MSEDPQLIDMSALRSTLLVAQNALRDERRAPDRAGDSDPALEAINAAITMLNPRRDPDAVHPSVDQGVTTTAMRAAHEALIAGGVQNPVEVLIVQSHDENGKTTGRVLASSAANPQDLLRVCLQNVQRNLSPALKQRKNFLENT